MAVLFDETSLADWREQVELSLDGRRFDEALVSRTGDGITVQPLYTHADAMPASGQRRTARSWKILQRLAHPVPHEASRLAQIDLQNGVEGFDLLFAGSPNARGYGLVTETADQFDLALGAIIQGDVRLWLDGGQETRHLIAFLLLCAETRGVDPAHLDASAGFDPISTWACNGVLAALYEMVELRLIDMIKGVREHGFGGSIFKADGRTWHAAGSSEAQELAYSLASAISYLRLCERAGVPLQEAAGLIDFSLAADNDQFLTIAKFRALRHLWSAIQTACGIEPLPARIHGSTAWRMLTRRDPYSNILRSTIAAFSAAVAGADTITVLPFSSALGLPDLFARRIARNLQHILREESSLDWVADAAAGSGALEALTGEMARHAWHLLQDIEAQGGIAAGLRSGSIQQAIASHCEMLRHDAATRKKPIVGTSEFASLSEPLVKTLETSPALGIEFSNKVWHLSSPHTGEMFADVITAARAGATLADLVTSRDRSAPERSRPLGVVLRLAEPFERLRDQADAHYNASGSRVRIMLACLGENKDFQARAIWAKSVFEAGGMEIHMAPNLTSPMDAADAFHSSGARAACICSSDEILAAEAEATAQALRVTGARHVYCIGDPGENAGRFYKAGVGTFIYEGCNILEILEQAHIALGIVKPDMGE